MSKHGYIILLGKDREDVQIVHVYSLNGQLLHQTKKTRHKTILSINLTEQEDNLLMAYNYQDANGTTSGRIRMVKLYNFQKIMDFDNFLRQLGSSRST